MVASPLQSQLCYGRSASDSGRTVSGPKANRLLPLLAPLCAGYKFLRSGKRCRAASKAAAAAAAEASMDSCGGMSSRRLAGWPRAKPSVHCLCDRHPETVQRAMPIVKYPGETWSRSGLGEHGRNRRFGVRVCCVRIVYDRSRRSQEAEKSTAETQRGNTRSYTGIPQSFTSEPSRLLLHVTADAMLCRRTFRSSKANVLCCTVLSYQELMLVALAIPV